MIFLFLPLVSTFYGMELSIFPRMFLNFRYLTFSLSIDLRAADVKLKLNTFSLGGCLYLW